MSEGGLSVRIARPKSFAKITPAPVQTVAAAPVIATQRSAGNQAALADRPKVPRYVLEQAVVARIHADIESITERMRSQILWESEERQVLAVIGEWAAQDRALPPGSGTPHIDEFLRKARQRAYKRSTARSGFIEQSAMLYDDLFVELEDDRRTAFEALVSGSREYRGPPGAADMPENFWATMGKKEAVGVWGILKGMGTSGTGMVDSGALAITQAMQAAGLDVADPASAAQWLAEQYDISGDAMFGKEEWSEGEELFLGMSAAEFSTHGGELVWQLVMMGKGTNSAKWALMVEKALGLASSLMAVEDSAKNIAAIFQRMQAESPNGSIDAAKLLQDPQFYRELTRLISSVYGAAAGNSQAAKRVNVLLDSAQVAPTVGQLVVIGTSADSWEDKKKQFGPVLMELLKQLVSVGGSVRAARAGSAPGKGDQNDDGKEKDDGKKQRGKQQDDSQQKKGESPPVKKPPPAKKAADKATTPKKKAKPAKKKAAPKKTAAPKKKPATKQAAAKKATAKKAAPKKAAPKSAAPKKAAPKKSASKKAAATKSAPASNGATKKAPSKSAPKKQSAPRAKPQPPSAEQLAASRAYLEELRKQPPSKNELGHDWDYKKRPTGTGEDWKVGDPINAPTEYGYPSWSTIRKRAWKTLAHNEIAARLAGTSKRYVPKNPAKAPPDIDPVKSLDDDELTRMRDSGKSRRGFEIEHAGIPQRMVRLMIGAGMSPTEARRIGRLGDPKNLEVVPRELHAVLDKVAAQKKFGRNKALGGMAFDDRDEHPLGSMAPPQLDDLGRALAAAEAKDPQPQNSDVGKARAELRLQLEKQRQR